MTLYRHCVADNEIQLSMATNFHLAILSRTLPPHSAVYVGLELPLYPLCDGAMVDFKRIGEEFTKFYYSVLDSDRSQLAALYVRQQVLSLFATITFDVSLLTRD
jgi:hypothetical protein